MKNGYSYAIDPNQSRFAVGAKVKGVFYGVQYRGRVIRSEAHTRNLSHVHQIELDAPISAFGLVRHRIHVAVWEEVASGNTVEAAL